MRNLHLLVTCLITLTACGTEEASIRADGTYSLDREDLIAKHEAAWMDELGDAIGVMPPQAVAEQKAALRATVEVMEVDLLLDPHGAFRLATTEGDDVEVVEGEWSREGRAIHLVETVAEGEPQELAVTFEATLADDGALVLAPRAPSPFALLLRRR